jgi:hypothetical protein
MTIFTREIVLWMVWVVVGYALVVIPDNVTVDADFTIVPAPVTNIVVG